MLLAFVYGKKKQVLVLLYNILYQLLGFTANHYRIQILVISLLNYK